MSFLERVAVGFIAALAVGALGASCMTSQPNEASSAASARSSASATSAPVRASATTSSGPSEPKSAAAASSPASATPTASAPTATTDPRKFADLVDGLSEPDTYFFSDNLISNETSYLQIAEALAKNADSTGVYLGVGPEQNFTYIALSKPTMAFIVDIRRGNMLLHLLYRAAFEEAESRAHFLALLVGRAAPDAANAPDASVKDVLALVEKAASSEATFKAAHEKLMKRITGYGLKLGKEDEKALSDMHKEFWKGGTQIRFELKENNGRKYPTLAELLEMRSPSGETGGFLATNASFETVQSLERAGKVVPLVGDFAGEKALPQLAKYLAAENLTVSVFYVSNVEQYLLEPKTWAKWVRNVKALPKNDKSLFLRAYLDQGKKHPKQLDGHRTASVLSRMVDFETSFGDKTTTTLYALSTDKLIAP
ncbi:MAG: hypothetical protein U0271_28600 [Polyangiaceae bacterium]